MKFIKSIAIAYVVVSATAVYASDTDYGQNPAFNLVAGGNNVFYGTANSDGSSFNTGAVYSWNASTNAYTGVTDNIPNPTGTPLVASDGSIYVTSSQGDSNPNGALYHIVNGVATVVHAFTNTSGEGANPNYITMVPDGRIFGTTLNGGSNNDGTIFVYNPKDGSFSTPINFSFAYGKNPYGLTYANGYLYGVTAGGGQGQGNIYEYDYLNNNVVVLHSFSTNNDVNYPQYPLTLSNDGNTLMGTAGGFGYYVGGGTFAYNIPNHSYALVWSGTSYYQATPPVQAKDGTWYQSAVSTDDHWDILAFSDGARNITPTVVYSGPNSSPAQGGNYQNIAINGLSYNPADNSLIATQQWGGSSGLGYINKFTANGLNTITATDVYDFRSTNVIIVNMWSDTGGWPSYNTIWAICEPSKSYQENSNNSDGYAKIGLGCHPTDTALIISGGSNTFPSGTAKYTWNVPNSGSLEYDNIDIGNGAFAYINFADDTGTKSLNYNHNDPLYGTADVQINQ